LRRFGARKPDTLIDGLRQIGPGHGLARHGFPHSQGWMPALYTSAMTLFPRQAGINTGIADSRAQRAIGADSAGMGAGSGGGVGACDDAFENTYCPNTGSALQTNVIRLYHQSADHRICEVGIHRSRDMERTARLS